MKTLRIGTASGGCTYERLEPAEELINKGNLDYLVFECLSERTIADLQKMKRQFPDKGYNPMLEERMRRLLPLAQQKGIKIISNMGGANTPAAVQAIADIARELGLKGLKIAMVLGDDITSNIHEYSQAILQDRQLPLAALDGAIVSANVYLGADPIRKALLHGADMVITGRVADAALFMGPLMYEFGWTASAPQFGQCILLGHLMECGAQVTGGYYADPGYKDVPDLHILGFPIAEMNESGDFSITKVQGSGGLVSVDVCKEQLLYEIGDPARYITPDAVADFSHVTFTQVGEHAVLCRNATSLPPTASYKVNIGYQDCFLGEAGISFGGSTALERARLAADIVTRRMAITGAGPDELRIDYIGYNSLYGDTISARLTPQAPAEIRLRIAVRTKTAEEAENIVREIQWLYINGPAGSSGIRSSVSPMLSVDNILVPKHAVSTDIRYVEVL